MGNQQQQRSNVAVEQQNSATANGDLRRQQQTPAPGSPWAVRPPPGNLPLTADQGQKQRNDGNNTSAGKVFYATSEVPFSKATILTPADVHRQRGTATTPRNFLCVNLIKFK